MVAIYTMREIMEFAGNIKKKQKKAIAEQYGLESPEAINPEKTREYEKYLSSPEAELERFLDNLSAGRTRRGL